MSQYVLSSHLQTFRTTPHFNHYVPAEQTVTPIPTTCRWSLHQISTYRWSLAEDVVQYRKAGIPAIGLWLKKVRETGEDQTVELISASGLSVSSLSWLGGFTGTEGLTHIEALDEAVDAIQLAGRLSAQTVVVVSGARGYHIQSHARRCTRSALIRLGDAAAEAGLMVTLLPESRPLSRPWSIFRDWEAALDVVVGCDHPHVKLALDIERFRPGLLPTAQLNDIVPYLSHMQISRITATTADTQLLQAGSEPDSLAEDIAALQHAGFSGYCEYEMWTEATWQSRYEDWLDTLSTGWSVVSHSVNR
ncbi:MAG: sugar phosphate isomerase/epimerase family protein [Planctomycetaceae bacterium]